MRFEAPAQPGNEGADISSNESSAGKDLEHVSHILRQKGPERKRKRILRCSTVLSIFFFVLSCAALFLAISYAREGSKPLALCSFFSLKQRYSMESIPIVSYLSSWMGESLKRDAYEILVKKKEELAQAERELRALDQGRENFQSGLVLKREQFEKHKSIFKDAEQETVLKKYEAYFNGETERRYKNYMELYHERKAELLEKKESLLKSIVELTGFIREADKDKAIPEGAQAAAFHISELKYGLMNKFLFYAERGEYESALKVLGRLSSLVDGAGAWDKTQRELFRKTLSIMAEYEKRLDSLRDASLKELKMSYIREDYSGALNLSREITSDGYMTPLLSVLNGVIERNARLTVETEEGLILRDNLRLLGEKALLLEKRGEREKALALYQNLLVFDLLPHDRDFIVKKIVSLSSVIQREEQRRLQNITAAAYLREARDFYRKGMEKEALERYSLVITECPSSDYVKEALSEIKKL